MNRLPVYVLGAVMVLSVFLTAPAPAAGCVPVAEVQSIIDAAPDGTATADDLSTKLRYGAGPFTLIDLTRDCVEPGELTVSSRRGLWLRNVMGDGVHLTGTDSTATVITDPAVHTITVEGGSARVETARTGNTLAVANAEIYAGKIFVTTASFRNVTGFFRGSDVHTMILDGDLSTFRIRGVGYRVLIDTST